MAYITGTLGYPTVYPTTTYWDPVRQQTVVTSAATTVTATGFNTTSNTVTLAAPIQETPKKKTNLEVLRESVDQICREGRERLVAA